MHAQSDTVLSLLESIQIPATPKAPAQSALQLLLTNWCENVDVFQGYWNLRVRQVMLPFRSVEPVYSYWCIQ
jgi:hypothetical protein